MICNSLIITSKLSYNLKSYTFGFKLQCLSTLKPLLPHLSHGDVVKTIRAVKDHTLHSQRLGEVFGGLSLARACRTFGSSVEVEVESPHQGAVASVRQEGYHQPVVGVRLGWD